MAGQVDATFWLDSDTLLVGGDMRLNNTATYLAIYNAKASSWEAYVGDTLNIPGPVQNIAFDSGAKDSFFISGVTAADGSAYLMKYGGGRFALLGLLYTYFSPLRVNCTNLRCRGVRRHYIHQKCPSSQCQYRTRYHRLLRRYPVPPRFGVP